MTSNQPGARVEIRPAVHHEYAALGEIGVRAYRALDGFPDDHWYLDHIADVAGRSGEAETLVAMVDGQPAGVVTYVPGPDTTLSEFDDPDAAGMRMLAVDPAFQRRGVGRALTEACLDLARRSGRRRMIVHSTQVQTAAHAMYRAMGFRHDPALDWAPEEGVFLTCFVFDLGETANPGHNP